MNKKKYAPGVLAGNSTNGEELRPPRSYVRLL